MRIARRGLAAAAVATAGAALAWLPLAAPAAATTATHVAIVVAGDRNACVPWHAGMTGADVLNDAQPMFETRYNSSGLLWQIDYQPASPDLNNWYWSYWQNNGSGWVYADTGPLTSTPAPGSVEGWSYVSMTTTPANAPRPPLQSYASICAGQDPTATPNRSPAPSSRTATDAAPAPPSRAGVAATTTGRAESHAPSASSDSTAHRIAARLSSAPIESPGSASPTGPTSSSSSPVAARHSSPSALPTVGTVAALVVVVALGAGGYLHARRQRP